MSIAPRVSRFLNAHGVPYRCVHLACDESPEAYCEREGEVLLTVDIVLLAKRPCLLVYPASHVFDLESFSQQSSLEVEAMDEASIQALDCDCQSAVLAPLPRIYGLDGCVDIELSNLARVCFHAGCPQTLISMSGDEFRFINSQAKVLPLSQSPLNAGRVGQSLAPRVRQQLASLQRLPAMPSNALAILELVEDPEACIADLASIVETDPSLSLQVMRYARSALFGYRGRIDNVRDAISAVLGFDLVSNIALGIATSGALEMPEEGGLSRDDYRKHSVYSAELSRSLAAYAAPEHGLNASKAYLCGLLHQFGILLIAHLFAPEFGLLAKLMEKNPQQSVNQLETQIMGLGQAKDILALGYSNIGSSLLELWNMPSEVVDCARGHCDLSYAGTNLSYVKLLQLVNAIITQEGFGYPTLHGDVASLADELGIPYAMVVQEVVALEQLNMEELSAMLVA